jgi:pimeloyl-ACP methyl ester carboxylesterase
MYPSLASFTDPTAKVNFIGHSMGAPTAITLAYLMARGSQEEMDAAARAGVPASPLFWTNKTYNPTVGIFSLTGVLGGTTIADYIYGSPTMTSLLTAGLKGWIMALGSNTSTPLTGSLTYDWQLDQWGIAQGPNDTAFDVLQRIFDSGYIYKKSNALFDLCIQNQDDPLLASKKMLPDTTYFSFSVSSCFK